MLELQVLRYPCASSFPVRLTRGRRGWDPTTVQEETRNLLDVLSSRREVSSRKDRELAALRKRVEQLESSRRKPKAPAPPAPPAPPPPPAPAPTPWGILLTEKAPYKVTSLVKGGLAESQKLLVVGDVLVMVEGKNVGRMLSKDLRALLRDPRRQKLSLVVERRGGGEGGGGEGGGQRGGEGATEHLQLVLLRQSKEEESAGNS